MYYNSNAISLIGFPFNAAQQTPVATMLPTAKHPSKAGMFRDGIEVLEYPFLTLNTFPEGFIQRIGMYGLGL